MLSLRSIRPVVFVVAATLATASTAFAQTNLGVANDFNVFVFGNHIQSGTDTEGRVAVGGNADYDNGSAGMTIASRRGGSTTDNLVVGGNYTNRFNTVNGNTIVGGNVMWNTPSANGNLWAGGAVNLGNGGGSVAGTIKYGTTFSGPGYLADKAAQGTTTVPVDFGAAYSSLSGLSQSLAGYSANGITSVAYGGITMTGTDSALNVFSLDASQLSGATGLNINATTGSTVIVNVTGSAATFSNFGMSINGTDKRNVLFNFKDATQINLTNFGFDGSILATNAAVSTTYGQLNGSLIAGSLSGTMESHDHTFTGNLGRGNGGNQIPEGGTGALVLAGMVFAGAGMTRVRKVK